jgi:hypothetical protein
VPVCHSASRHGAPSLVGVVFPWGEAPEFAALSLSIEVRYERMRSALVRQVIYQLNRPGIH